MKMPETIWLTKEKGNIVQAEIADKGTLYGRQDSHKIRIHAKAMPAICIWSEDEPDYSTWETSCGNTFMLEAGTPRENEMIFCPYCGRLLVERDE